MRTVNAKFDEDEHRKLRVMGAAKDKGVAELVVDIVKEYTDKHCPTLEGLSD